MAVELNYRYFGGQGKPPLIIIHGLLGSSRNWLTIGRELAAQYEVFALDLRNHGESAHFDEMTFEAMAEDLSLFMQSREIPAADVMGHSLGGKVAMLFVAKYPKNVNALTIVDIAPKDYPLHHEREFEAMLALDLDSISSRKEAELFLETRVEDWAMRQFLMTNLKRNEDGTFSWGVNLKGLHAALEVMSKNPLDEASDVFMGPTHFIIGENSSYFKEEDEETARLHFPKSFYSTIAGAGHNPHIEKKAAFLEAIDAFSLIDWGCEI